MASLTTYKGLSIIATPSGAGGAALTANFKALIDNSPKSKLDATAAPGVGDDLADGYYPGSLWVDVTNSKVYICKSNGAGAAVWIDVTAAATFADQNANEVFAGPASGADAQPAFRALVADDIPSLTLAKISDAGTAAASAVEDFEPAGAVATAVTGLFDLKGGTDCSGNPNYPASALKGDAYAVTVAGKIGGASGKSVDVGDVYIATADNAGGDEAAVGTSWIVLEHNLQGALLASNNLSDVTAATARSNLGLVIGTDVQAYSARLARKAAAPITLTSTSNSVAVAWGDSEQGNHVLTEDTTIANPSGIKADGDIFVLRITQHASAAKTVAFDTQYRGSATTPLPTIPTTLSKTHYWTFKWNAADTKADLVAVNETY